MYVLVRTTNTKWGKDIYDTLYGKEAKKYYNEATSLEMEDIHLFKTIGAARTFSSKLKEELNSSYEEWEKSLYRDNIPDEDEDE